MTLLAATVLLPAAAGLLLAAGARRLSVETVKALGIAAAGGAWVLSLGLLAAFTPGAGDQFTESFPWIPALGASWALGADGISLAMILLTTSLTPLALLAAWSGATRDARLFPPLMLFLETAMLGVFAARDLLLFYVFWEASLIPMFFIIGVWGGPRRIYSTVKFFLFTMAGSVLMLAALIALALAQQGSGAPDLSFAAMRATAGGLPLATQRWLFWAFFIAFAVKVPCVPLHTWLPDAHVEAPTAGSVILAGVLLKLGGYGIVQLCAGMFPEALVEARMPLAILGVVAIVYGAAMVMVQTDLKRLVAYSSVSHMGYVVVGIASLTAAGVNGGVLQMVSHGLTSGALFAIVGLLYERTHTREMAAYGGVAARLPHFAWAFLLVTLASIGLPGTSGFPAEFLALLGLAQYSLPLAVVAVAGVVLGALYMLTMFRRVMHGPPGRHVAELAPVTLREGFVLACFAAGILALGVRPDLALRLFAPDVDALLGAAGVK